MNNETNQRPEPTLPFVTVCAGHIPRQSIARLTLVR